RVADRGYPGKSTQYILNPEGVASASCKFAFHQPYRNPFRVAESPWAIPGLPIAATLGKAHNISSTLKGLRPHPANSRSTNPIATPSGLPNRRGLSQGSRRRQPWARRRNPFGVETQNSELRTQNSELRTQNSELRTQNPELRTSPFVRTGRTIFLQNNRIKLLLLSLIQQVAHPASR